MLYMYVRTTYVWKERCWYVGKLYMVKSSVLLHTNGLLPSVVIAIYICKEHIQWLLSQTCFSYIAT